MFISIFMMNHKPMQFEGVGAVPMGGILLQIARQIDDLDGAVRAFLNQKM